MYYGVIQHKIHYFLRVETLKHVVLRVKEVKQLQVMWLKMLLVED